MTDGITTATSAGPFRPRCIAIDLEVDRHDGKIREIGAIRADTGDTLRRPGRDLAGALDALDNLADGAAFVLGHNIATFDLAHLAAARPMLRILRLPVVDTLWLNPLAFPKNPYHHLVKHYQDGQLQGCHRNDPVEDARLALEIFGHQWQALADAATLHPDRIAAWHWLTTLDNQVSGMQSFFATLRNRPRPSRAQALGAIERCLAEQCCQTARQSVLQEAGKDSWPLAYAMAWLSVAGGNSVMPPWVRHSFPAAGAIVRRLRDVACTDKHCAWCREHHDARKALRHWFDLPDFRPEPKDAKGRPLQQAIVEAAMSGRHVLGILPTGTGKSVCYQIPALSRFDKTGALTVVISPLVALMADQVAGLAKRGIDTCAALNGLLSMPERKQVLDGVRLGNIGILIVSPEQLRNRTLRRALEQREIGAWVLDEAHCLSKWGHDFRPDYRYVARFIREKSGTEAVPPVLCLTATAKPDVVLDIVGHFKDKVGIDLTVFNGGANRDNLDFVVQTTTADRKFADAHALIAHELPAGTLGGAIVYCATRKQTEEMAKFLCDKGLAAAHFHSKLQPEAKKSVQERFIRNDLRVIAATNAFGMGIDKPDVRLVVHADIPGSLENYLQEAGRAGRDRTAARCVLLHTDDDVERQFGMSARSRLAPKEIRAILRSLRALDSKRRKAGRPGDAVIATSGEILQEDEEADFLRDSASDDTRVRTAVSWLEEAALLTREENVVQVFPSSLRIGSVAEARRRLEHQPQDYRESLLAIVEALITADADEGISTDELIGLSGLTPTRLRKAFADLEAIGLASNDAALTAFLHVGVPHSSRHRLETAARTEDALIDELRRTAPDFGKGDSAALHLRMACQHLKDAGFKEALPETLRRLLKGLEADGRDEGNETGSIKLRRIDGESVRVTLNRDWPSLAKTAQLRRRAAQLLLEHLAASLPAGSRGVDLLAESTMGRLTAALDGDLTLKAEVRDIQKLLDCALLWLHEQEVVRLNKGLTVFRQAMTLRIDDDWKKQFGKVDYEPLQLHYDEQRIQVHVMAHYARLGLEKMADALHLAFDYFRLPQADFLKRWLPGREAELRRQTMPQSWMAIVEDLGNKAQRDIVADERDRSNVLVLAGPGSGKTRVLVHRIAYLIRVRRENPGGILALAYNRHAATQIRQRLETLVGDDARGVLVMTLHAFAMRLVGASFADRVDAADENGFKEILLEAIALLKGEGLATDEADTLRVRLLGHFRWILVDEYQDIGPEQYALISAIAGRKRDEDEQLSMFAVGDDDQNIYAFNGASVEFIRRFEADYGAKPVFLTDNYRSTAHIVSAANDLIERVAERMKAGHPIRIDKARSKTPPGGEWQTRDRVGQGCVQILHAGRDAQSQAVAAITEFERLARLDGNWDWARCAVIARRWHWLGAVRACCEWRGIPAQLAAETPLPFWRLRETRWLLDWLHAQGHSLVSAPAMRGWLDERMADSRRPDNPWFAQLAEAIDEYALDTGDAEVPVTHFRDWLAEWGREVRRRQTGLLLVTAHRAKGLEFDHVIVLDGSWDERDGTHDHAARLYYVAMTRARHTLTLLRLDGRRCTFVDDLADGSHLRRRAPVDLPRPPLELARQYHCPSLDQINIGLAGREPQGHSLHRAIARLSPGDPLSLERTEHGWRLVDMEGAIVGKMAAKFVLPAGMRCLAATVRAVLTWDKTSADPKYGEPRCERWEVVVPDLILEPDVER